MKLEETLLPVCLCFIDSLILLSYDRTNPYSGIAAYVKALRPEIKVIGVEADDAAGDSRFQLLYAKHRYEQLSAPLLIFIILNYFMHFRLLADN